MSYNLIEELYRELADLRRMLTSISVIGIVSELSKDFAKARVKIGDLETDFLPYLTSRSSDKAKSRWPLCVGEQVYILSPGDLNHGVILGVIPTKAQQDGHDNPNHFIQFADGVTFEFDEKTKTLKVETTGPIIVKSTGPAGITLEAALCKIEGNLEVSGDVKAGTKSLLTHFHGYDGTKTTTPPTG